jgi:flagellar basal-body rod protein FlgC
MELKSVMDVSASGLRAQSLRIRVIAENLANANSVANEPGGTPYARKIVNFQPDIDRETGATGVRVAAIETDSSKFKSVYKPGTPGADAAGYVKMPNVNSMVEMTDIKAAQRSYEANLNAIEAAKNLTMRTIDLLK